MRRNIYIVKIEAELKPKKVKAKVYVTLKSGVLDPQGKAIHHSLELMGFARVAGVRQGKYFEVELNGAPSSTHGARIGDVRAEVEREVERIAREVLSNPVIEDYRIEIDNEENSSEDGEAK